MPSRILPEADVHVVPAARRLLQLPERERAAGDTARRVGGLIRDPYLRHPRVFHALIRLARSEARRAQSYRPLRRLAVEVPVSRPPFEFAEAMQMRREAGEYAGNTLAQKAEAICALEADRTTLTPDWRLRFSRRLQLAALESQDVDKILASQSILEKANTAWRPHFDQESTLDPDSQTPRLMTRYDPQGSLALLRREISALTTPPAYVQNSPQRQALLSHQSAHVAQTFKQFIEELPFMVAYSATSEEYHPDREPLVRGQVIGVHPRIYGEVEQELERLPAPLRDEVRPYYLVFQYGNLLAHRNEDFLNTGMLARMQGPQLGLVQRFAYFVASPYPFGSMEAISSLFEGRSPAERARICIAYWHGTSEGKALCPEPDYVNSSSLASKVGGSS